MRYRGWGHRGFSTAWKALYRPAVFKQWRVPESFEETMGIMSRWEIEQLFEEGYVYLDRLFEPYYDIDPVVAEVEDRLDILAMELHKRGLVSDRYAQYDYTTRIMMLEEEYPDAPQLIQVQNRLGVQMQQLYSIAEFGAAAVQSFDDKTGFVAHPRWNLCAHTPHSPHSEVPMHQDAAYQLPSSHKTLQIMAIVPLVDMDADMGTFQIMKKEFSKGRVLPHHIGSIDTKRQSQSYHLFGPCPPERFYSPSRYLYIDEEDLVPHDLACIDSMSKGDALILTNLTPYRVTGNQSVFARWTMDMRWQRVDDPYGYEEIKPPIQIFYPEDPFRKLDWTSWARQSRFPHATDPLSVNTDGPWFDQWETKK